MRGSNQNKAIYDCNQQIKKTLYFGEGLFNVLICIFYAYNKCFNYTKFILGTIPELITVFLIFKISRPTIRKENNTVTLVSPGADLSGKGLPSTLFDSLIVCMLAKILVVFSYYFLIIYLLIPLSMLYEFFYKPYKVFNKID